MKNSQSILIWKPWFMVIGNHNNVHVWFSTAHVGPCVDSSSRIFPFWETFGCPHSAELRYISSGWARTQCSHLPFCCLCDYVLTLFRQGRNNYNPTYRLRSNWITSLMWILFLAMRLYTSSLLKYRHTRGGGCVLLKFCFVWKCGLVMMAKIFSKRL